MKIAIIGAGAMGGAIADGLLKAEAVQPRHLSVANPSPAPLDHFALQGASVTSDNATATLGADLVIVAVKPWIVETVLKEIKPMLDYNRQTLVVVAAGVSGEQMKEWLYKDDEPSCPQLFIAIPNTAIAVKSSVTFIAPIVADDETTDRLADLFNTVGETILCEERMLGAGTTLASCGIAYAMRYVRAASEGGVELGFKAEMAKKIVLQTVKGAVELLQANGNHPEAEIDKVTTPGGLTIKGLNEMEHAGFTSAVIRGLKAGLK